MASKIGIKREHFFSIHLVPADGEISISKLLRVQYRGLWEANLSQITFDQNETEYLPLRISFGGGDTVMIPVYANIYKFVNIFFF